MDKSIEFTIPKSSFSLDTELRDVSKLLRVDSDAFNFLVCITKRLKNGCTKANKLKDICKDMLCIPRV